MVAPVAGLMTRARMPLARLSRIELSPLMKSTTSSESTSAGTSGKCMPNCALSSPMSSRRCTLAELSSTWRANTKSRRFTRRPPAVSSTPASRHSRSSGSSVRHRSPTRILCTSGAAWVRFTFCPMLSSITLPPPSCHHALTHKQGVCLKVHAVPGPHQVQGGGELAVRLCERLHQLGGLRLGGGVGACIGCEKVRQVGA